MSLQYLNLSGDLPTVCLALAIGVLGMYATLDIALQVRAAEDRMARRLWKTATALALGTSIWATHVVAMAAAQYPVQASYDIGTVGASWALAIVVAFLPANVLSAPRLASRRLLPTVASSSAGFIAAHYLNIYGLQAGPTFHFRTALVVLVALLTWVGVHGGLALFYRFRDQTGPIRERMQLVAALVTGSCLSGIHFLAMASVAFDPNAVAPNGRHLDVEEFGDVIAMASLVFLSITVLLNALGRKAAERADLLHGSLSRAEEELRTVTLSDAVTGLPNRLVFQDRVKQALARGERELQPLAVLLIAFDERQDDAHRWTPDRDLGLMRMAADRLRPVWRSYDTLTSAGNGQFLVLMEGADVAIAATRAAQAALEAVRATVALDTGAPVLPKVSIGITISSPEDDDASLVVNASAAMLAARRQGGNRFSFFEERMNEEAQAAAEMLYDLRQAVRRSELMLVYQPKVFAEGGQVAGVEALLRWKRGGAGFVSPAVFIPLAERHGVIDEIGAWVLEEGCRQIRRWSDDQLNVRVAINVSAVQLRQPDLAARIGDCMARHRIDPGLLTLEITETAAMEDASRSLQIFGALTAAGVGISIDDFGTGYSSLSHLRRLPLRQLKIDRSFVCDLDVSTDARSIVEAIVNMAHSLRLEVVAEGVETPVQRDILAGMGCEKLQGFLFHRPVEAGAIGTLFQASDDDTRGFAQETDAALA